MNGTIGTHKSNDRSTDAPEARKSNHNGRLDSWKEIAAYLNRSTRCAQRWEKSLNLPVHRIRYIEGHTVYAYVAELDAWRRSRELIHAPDLQEVEANTAPAQPEPSFPAPRSRWSLPLFNLCQVLLRRVPLRSGRC